MIDYLAYISVKFLSLFFMLLPVRLALFIGRVCGLIFYYVNTKKRRIVYKNLRIAFADVYSLQELRNISRQFYKNFWQNLVEALIIPKVNKSYIKKYVKVDNLHYIDEAVKKGNGAILLTFHFGNWEISHIICSLLGYPFTILVKPQRRFKRLAKFFESFRIDKGCCVIATGMMTREIMRTLKNNQAIGMAADQSGRDGMLIPFFNRLASLPTGAIRFALKCEAPIIPVFTFREKGPYQHIALEKPLYLTSTGINEQNVIYEELTQIKSLAEKYIKTYPEQYFWFYKVWKYSTERSVVILSDKKAGHLNQAQAVLKVLQESKYKIKSKVIEVHFKNRLRKVLFNLFAFLDITRHFRKNFKYLKLFLTNKCFKELSSTYADIVISCGSSLSFINIISSYENNARSVVIMKPALLSLSNFDLAIIPEHDNPPLSRNIIRTKSALNLIDNEYLIEASERLRQKISLENAELRIGIFIGGNTKSFVLKENIIKELVNQIKAVSLKYNADLLITTSRRTPKPIESLLKSEFRDYPLCRLLIIADENNAAEAVGGILGLCNIIIVSPDSISMVSEAASAGKFIFVFDDTDCNNKLPKKHNKLLKRLSDENYIYFVKCTQLRDTIINIINTKPPIRVLNDRGLIKEPLLRLF